MNYNVQVCIKLFAGGLNLQNHYSFFTFSSNSKKRLKSLV